jgi:hypothetical protein
MVALARTNFSKLDSTRTLSDADFFSIDCDRNPRPCVSSSVLPLLWTWERNSEGEKVVEDRR